MTACVLYLAWVLADPPPGDAYRLPPLPVLTEGRKFNAAYRGGLEKRLGWEPYHRGELRAALAEARWLYDVWDAAEGAHPDWVCDGGAKTCYRRRLRVLLGRDAYRRMELPPPVPVWRFGELR